jgi:hypothetical protein
VDSSPEIVVGLDIDASHDRLCDLAFAIKSRSFISVHWCGYLICVFLLVLDNNLRNVINDIKKRTLPLWTIT